MDVTAIIAQFRVTQNAFRVIGALMLTAYLFPPQAKVADNEQFDFIIVGAGSAGCVIADRLSELPQFRVLLIDAGGEPPIESLTPGLFSYLPSTKYDWNITSEKEDSPECSKSTGFNLTSGKVLGGGSSFNYLYYVRGAPADYNAWAEAANDETWNWNGVIPYFIKSENLQSEALLNSHYRIYHGTNGFLKTTRETREEVRKYLPAFEEHYDIVPDINGEQTLGYTLPLYTIANGVRQSTAYATMTKNKYRHNLHVLKNKLVTEILFDENNNAVGVKAILDDNRAINIKATKEVIISAGALHSPQLLMLSGIGPKAELETHKIEVRSDLPVGHNYNDHVVTFVSIKLDKSNETVPPMNPTTQPFPSFAGYVALNSEQTYPDYQAINYVIPNDSSGPAEFCLFGLAQDPYICQNLLEAGKGRNTLMTVLALLHPKSRGNLTLRSIEPMIPPRICTGTFAEESDLETLVSSIEDYIKVLNTTHFKNLNAELVDLKLKDCGPLDLNNREYLKCYIRTIKSTMYHYSGTCSLGAVVDSKLRVFNVNRLRVADASIMPALVSGNINAPVIMIGEKVSDMIKSEYLSAPSLYDYFVSSMVMDSLYNVANWNYFK